MKICFTALLLLSSVLLGADDIYNSNILGMKLGRIWAPDEAAGDYYIRISEKDDIIHEHLFEKGRLFFARSITIQDGLTITKTEKSGELEIEKRKDGLIISEEVKRDGEPAERSDYSYSSGRLESSVFYFDDLPVYRERYFYTKDGRLLEVSRDYEDERRSNASFSFLDGRIYRYGFTAGNQNIYIKFDKYGIIFSDSYGEGSQNETREYGTLDNGNRFELIKDSSSGENRLLVFNAENQIISSVTKDQEGSLLEEAGLKYRGDLISELRIRSHESVEVFVFEYDAEGELKTETYIKNGNIVKYTEYQSEDQYTEKLYRYGEAILEIKYVDGVRSQTEQLQE